MWLAKYSTLSSC